MGYFETRKPGSKMDNAGKWHLAWSTTPAAAPENLPHAHVHQPKSIGVPRTPQPHPGVHIDTHTLPKSSPLFPALALKTRRPPAERSEPAGFTPRQPWAPPHLLVSPLTSRGSGTGVGQIFACSRGSNAVHWPPGAGGLAYLF